MCKTEISKARPQRFPSTNVPLNPASSYQQADTAIDANWAMQTTTTNMKTSIPYNGDRISYNRGPRPNNNDIANEFLSNTLSPSNSLAQTAKPYYTNSIIYQRDEIKTIALPRRKLQETDLSGLKKVVSSKTMKVLQ